MSQLLRIREGRARWFALGLATASGAFILDILTSREFVLISLLAVPPFMTAVGASRTQTLVVALYSISLAIVAGVVDNIFGTFEYVVKLAVVGLAALFAVRVATVRVRAELSSALDYAVANALATTSTLAEATPMLLEEIGALLGHRAGAIWELTPDDEKLNCVEIRHTGNGALARFADLSRELEFPMGIGLPGRVWRAAKPAWLPDIRLDSSFARGQAATAAGLTGAIAFPITTPRRVRGVVEFYTDNAREPDDDLFPVLQRLGRQIGQQLERRGAEEAVRQTEALRGAVLESALDCVITMNHEGIVVEFNPAAERTFGYRRSDAVGRPLAELIIPPSLRERHRAGLSTFVSTGEGPILGQRLELTGMRDDGSEFPIEISVTRIGTQEPAMFAGYLRDLTERKQAEESMQRLATIVEHSNDAIIAVKPGGEIIAWNPSAERLYGYGAEEAIGRNISMTVPPDRMDEVVELLRRAEAGEAVQNFETIRMRKGGSLFDISLTLSPLRDPDGNLIGTAGIARDITVQKQAERERLQLLGDLESRRQELEFLASASAALDRSLDLDQTLQRVADLAVPYLADGCMVDLLGETGVIRRVASASGNPEIGPILARLQSHELDLDGPHPIAAAIRTGRLQVIEEVTDELRQRWATDDAYLEDVRAWPGRAAVVAPMRARGRMLGAIALASFSERRFTPRGIETIEELARRAGVAVDNARLYGERSYIASRLQQSLLPPHLPDVPGLEIAARFRPAGEAYDVGGDFYDIFETGKGSWAIALGDVCGKGPDAAALTALARHTLRATAIRAEQSPEHILGVLNDVLIAEAPTQQFLTVTYADVRIGDTGTEATVASAGHPLPLMLHADGRLEHVGEPGTLLGIVPDPELRSSEIELYPGDTLVFYTDGVTEARTREGMFGSDGLMSTVSACSGCDAAEVAERIEQTLLGAQIDRPRDDIAIVVVQIPANGSPAGKREPALAARPSS